MCSGGSIESFIQSAGGFAGTAIADKEGFIQFAAMVAAGAEVSAVGVTVIAKSAETFADRCIDSANIFHFTVSGEGAFVFRFVKMVMFLEGTMLFDLFGDSRGILVQMGRNTAEGVFLFESFFDCDTVIQSHMFLIASNRSIHKYLISTVDRGHKES